MSLAALPYRYELGGTSIPDRNRAGLVEQHSIDIAGGFDCLAALGNDVGLERTVHTRDADGRQQGTDGRGDQAHQKRH